MFFAVRKKFFKNCSLKGSLGNQEWLFYGITADLSEVLNSNFESASQTV